MAIEGVTPMSGQQNSAEPIQAHMSPRCHRFGARSRRLRRQRNSAAIIFSVLATLSQVHAAEAAAEPDLELLPVSPLPNPNGTDGSNTATSTEASTTPTVQLIQLSSLGGKTPTHGPWDGHAVLVTDHSPPHQAWRGGRFEILPPLGGCTTSSGDLTRTSVNAAENKCDVAVNGSPFARGGGCIGQSLSDGARICPDCPEWAEIPTLGLIVGSDDDDDEEGESSAMAEGFGNGTATSPATWVIGTGLTYDISQSMSISNSIVGHVPGWLVRSGNVVIPEDDPGVGGQIAPRTAVGISSDGRTLILLVVDGCEHCPNFMGGPKGLTVRAMADEMVKLGAFHAMSLDGGGSSTLVHGGRVVNFPTGWGVPLGPFGKERAVSTILCVRLDGDGGAEGGGEGEEELE